MATEVRLPQWGMGMQEGTVVSWLRAEGDRIEEGDPLVEIESEKVTDTIYAPESGVLARILRPEGEDVRVYETLAIIASPDEALNEPLTPAGSRPGNRPGQDQASEAALDQVSIATDRRTHRQIEPRARRLAEVNGVDLEHIQGSGPDGRVTERDVQEALARPEAEKIETVPLSSKRAVIARRMVQSLQTMAQLTLVSEVDVTELEAWRARRPPDRGIGYNEIFIAAVGRALAEHPHLNARLEADGLLMMREVNVGLAVSVEDGLVVPVVRQVNSKSVEVISREIRELVARARSGRLSFEDVSGGNFTVTNLGAYGVDAFTPIINPPESGILGVGRISDRAAWHQDDLVRRKVVTLSLTFDHRITDGLPAAIFLQTIGRIVNDFEKLVGSDS
jgi:pyruvate dehydrogenase E2 component (dihydrolipoamide acetyltransferase)